MPDNNPRHLKKVLVDPDLHEWLLIEKVKRHKKTVNETLKELVKEAGYFSNDDDDEE